MRSNVLENIIGVPLILSFKNMSEVKNRSSQKRVRVFLKACIKKSHFGRVAEYLEKFCNDNMLQCAA